LYSAFRSITFFIENFIFLKIRQIGWATLWAIVSVRWAILSKKYGHPDDGGESHFPEAFFQTKSWRPKLGRLAKNQQVFIISNRPILVRVWQYICM
jgi:hypothetical protein